MMKKIYTAPYRVYLCVLGFAILGIIAGTKLPISLYPNSTRPVIGVWVSYGNLTYKDFTHRYGRTVYSTLSSIDGSDYKVDEISSNSYSSGVQYSLQFAWGADPKEAKSKVRSAIDSLAGRLPKEIRDSINVYNHGGESGIFAVSFFSDEKSINDVYEVIEPILTPLLAKVEDAGKVYISNPDQKEVIIRLNLDSMLALGIYPKDIKSAIDRSLYGVVGGYVRVGRKYLQVTMPRDLNSIGRLENLLIRTQSGKLVPLSNMAYIDISKKESRQRIYKTSGTKSIILIATPKSGGNIKKMGEDVLNIIKAANPLLPKDIKHKVLVDPSTFIKSSVNNVLHEVFISASIAVLVLFLFIGSLKNTITAAIEIPLSIILAFIIMKYVGMNLNLISLGGLALSAGMNVDASVVVMENIARNFKEIDGNITFREKVDIIVASVKEVMGPVISSTIASLVVFLPLAMTSELTNAILGDLAKAVVFSHGFSAFVALILVPTIRLHIIANSKKELKVEKSVIEGFIIKLENGYGKTLEFLIKSKKAKVIGITTTALTFLILVLFAYPELKREIIGTPDSDWVVLNVQTSGNNKIQQMETVISETEAKIFDLYTDKVLYTFVNISKANRGHIMIKLKNKSHMNDVWKMLEKDFENNPTTWYNVSPWNPAELPIPNPPQMKLVIKGSSAEDKRDLAEALIYELKDKSIYKNLWSNPGLHRSKKIVLRPYVERFSALAKKGINVSSYNIVDLARTISGGKYVDDIDINNKTYGISMSFPKGIINSKEDLESLPIKVGSKFIPLKALLNVSVKNREFYSYKESGHDLINIFGKLKKEDMDKKDEALIEARSIINNFMENDAKTLGIEKMPSVTFLDAEIELSQALKQLGIAIGLSILLIMLTLLFQLGDIAHVMIVLSAIPTGVMGVIFSLFTFGSTLSLNSALGVILLNGISVANSIILVDFFIKLTKKGISPREAAVIAAKKRLRPILITSLTTILGMLPIALGLGDGGKVLQPLGISVAGGLWFSMVFTLFIVPVLEVLYMEFKNRLKLGNTAQDFAFANNVSISNATSSNIEGELVEGEIQ